MSASELADWHEYAQLEPFGAHRDNMHAALIAMIIANSTPGRRKKSYKMEDFMLRDRNDQKQQQTAQTLNIMRVLAKRAK